MQIESLSFLTPREKEILSKNKIKTLSELLYYFPYKYLDAPTEKFIQDVKNGEYVTISGVVQSVKSNPGFFGASFTKAIVADSTDSIEVIWWNMPYLAKTISVEQKIILTGTVAVQKAKKQDAAPKLFINSPKIVRAKNINIKADGSLFQTEDKNESKTAVYTELREAKNFSIKKVIEKALKSSEFKKLPNLVPEDICKNLHLGDRKQALIRRHFPQNKGDVTWTNKFFAFEEIFTMQIYREHEKSLRKDSHSYPIVLQNDYTKTLNSLIPFKLTSGQQKVLGGILEDLQKTKPMSRLVEGDVGSGKTILALAASLATIRTRTRNGKHLQVAYIAPTEILANQHFETFSKILTSENVTLALLTRSGGKIYPSKIEREKYTSAPKTRIKKLLDDGKIDIVIGTHALFNKSILFEHLGLIIIDEQHRFGVKQRMNLIEKHKTRSLTKAKSKYKLNPKNRINLDDENPDDENEILKHYPIPHLLSMSATPIPRTLALTIYGDLDLSVLDELPPGRKRATTIVAKSQARNNIYKEMFEYLGRGKQAYIIAPRISDDEDDTTASKKSSVEYEQKRIRKILDLAPSPLGRAGVGVLHGKMNKNEKEEVIEKFYKNEIQILISTTVVEVGVSVANATFMIIENADTFGLAQLHQLRGRVERSTDISKCYLLTDSEDENSLRRLAALEKSNNGFELAEIDLTERGPGSLIGNRQSGLSDIGMEAIKNRKLVEIAKKEAEKLLANDPKLSQPQHSPLREKIEALSIHEE
jgi:ATP-dependent DNA helicase RecG